MHQKMETKERKGSLAEFPEVKQDLLRRMRTVVGHTQGIERMIAEERYCIDILKQIAAVQGQLSYIANELTKAHMKSCMVEAIQRGHGDEVVEELGEVLKYLR